VHEHDDECGEKGRVVESKSEGDGGGIYGG